MTKLDRYLSRKKISNASIARATRYHRNHISRVRNGRTEPTRECIAAIFEFIQREVDKTISIEELFEFRSSQRDQKARRKVS